MGDNEISFRTRLRLVDKENRGRDRGRGTGGLGVREGGMVIKNKEANTHK